jgi:hypothetical protein
MSCYILRVPIPKLETLDLYYPDLTYPQKQSGYLIEFELEVLKEHSISDPFPGLKIVIWNDSKCWLM